MVASKHARRLIDAIRFPPCEGFGRTAIHEMSPRTVPPLQGGVRGGGGSSTGARMIQIPMFFKPNTRKRIRDKFRIRQDAPRTPLSIAMCEVPCFQNPDFASKIPVDTDECASPSRQ